MMLPEPAGLGPAPPSVYIVRSETIAVWAYLGSGSDDIATGWTHVSWPATAEYALNDQTSESCWPAASAPASRLKVAPS